MTSYPRMTDTRAWNKRYAEQYRKYPRFLLYAELILILPFVLIYWYAKRFEVIVEVITGEDDYD